MVNILDQAIAALKALPVTESERIAWEIIERLDDKSEWDQVVQAAQSQQWLERQSKLALDAYEKVSKSLAKSHISLPRDDYLREDAYWKGFDELPDEVRELAESNFKLWRQDANHPKLRFKQIHAAKPIFSFRVGLGYRTVGVRTEDDTIAWFWVGSVSQFETSVSE